MAILALTLPITALASGSMRCHSRIVNEGDQAAELLAACGEPALRDRQYAQGPQGAYLADTEIWTYDFGPQQLLRVVTLRDGRISNLETDGYGYTQGTGGSCNSRQIYEGLTKYRLLHTCGEPLTKRAESILRPLYDRPELYRRNGDAYGYRNQYVTPAYREEWVYNLGSRSPMLRVVMEDGRVTDVESLDDGFDR